MVMGIDIGGSAVKIVGLDGDRVLFAYYELDASGSIKKLADEVARKNGYEPGDFGAVMVTGISAARCDIENAVSVTEIESIGRGGTWLAGEDRALIASIGTGTAFILAGDGGYRHLGGSGIGGGALRSLAGKALGVTDMKLFDYMCAEGDLKNIDLRVGDLFKGGGTLDPNLTAANLCRASGATTDQDWALGLTNMVLQCIGTMCMLTCTGRGLDTVILTGALTGLDVAPTIFGMFEKMYGIRYIIPKHAACATAIGAALLGQ